MRHVSDNVKKYPCGTNVDDDWAFEDKNLKDGTVEALGVTTSGVLAEVTAERSRQDEKWGEQNLSPIEWQGILMEEVGEQAREANENHFEGKDSLVKYRKELVQVAAVAVNMIECLDRGKWVSK